MKFSRRYKTFSLGLLALAAASVQVQAQVLSFEQAKQRADAGDAYAQAVVSIHYSLGWQVPKNVDLALQYAMASAKAGHSLGAYRVGAALRSGEGVDKDEERGLSIQAETADGLNNMSGDPYAMTSLGVMLFQGKILQENKREAARLYKAAADMGYAPALFNYAMCAEAGHGIRKDPQVREDYLKKAAALDYPLALEILAQSGATPTAAPSTAPAEQIANQQQVADADEMEQRREANLLSQEEYVPALSPSDPEWPYVVLTIRDVKKAAEAGDAYAQAVLSIHYSLGWKVPQDHQLAYQYAKRSADQGNALGLYRLGSALRKGEGVEKDEEAGKKAQLEAVAGLEAMTGSPYADTARGVLLYDGSVLPQNKYEAWRLYIYAAQKGYPPAASNLIYWPRKSDLAPVSDTRSRLYSRAEEMKGFDLSMKNPILDDGLKQVYDELLVLVSEDQKQALAKEQTQWTSQYEDFARRGGAKQALSQAWQARKAELQLRLFNELGGADEVPKILTLAKNHFEKGEILEGSYALDRANNISYKAPNFDTRPQVTYGREFAETYLAKGDAQMDVYDETIVQPGAGYVPNAGHSFEGVVGSLMSYHKLYPRNGVEDGEVRLKDPLAADAYDGLARFKIKEGEYLEALANARRALEIRKDAFGDNHYLTKRSLRVLGDVYAKLGSYERARVLYDDASQVQVGAEKNQQLEASNLMASRAGLALRDGKKEEALHLMQSCLAIRQAQLGNEHPQTTDALTLLGDVCTALGNYQDARKHYAAALDQLSRRAGNFNKGALACIQRLAGLDLADGNYPNAEDGYRLVRRCYERMLGAQHPQTTAVTRQLAVLLILSGKNEEARAIVEKWVNRTHSEMKEMLTTGESQRIDWSADNLSFGLPAITLPPLEMANLILKWKGVVLDSLMEDMAMKGSDGAQLVKIRDLKTELTKLLSGDGKFDAKKAENLQKQIDELEQASLHKEIVRSSEWVTFDEIQAALPARSALIDFVRYSDIRSGRDAYGVLVLGSEKSVQYFAIEKGDEIDGAVSAYRAAVATGNEGQLKTALDELQQKLWLPLRDNIPSGTERLYIGPDGVLNFMSFATLLDRDGKFAGESYEFAYLGSGRDLLRPGSTPANRDIAIFANPKFQSDKAKIQDDEIANKVFAELRSAEINQFSKLQLAPLPGTKVEAESVKAVAEAAAWKAAVHQGEDASKVKVSEIKAPAVLHLATHGFFLGAEPESNHEASKVGEPAKPASGLMASLRSLFGGTTSPSQAERGMQVVAADGKSTPGKNFIRAMNPMRQSGLALSGGQSTLEAWAKGRFPDTRNDGILTAEEVAALNLDGTWLVALSACETGVGKVVSGEGVFGLRRAFMMAGAQNLLMTLWPVSDATTPKIMHDFYKLGLSSLDAVSALAKVQRDWLQKLRSENGLLAAVRDAGPFALVAMSRPGAGRTIAAGSKRDLADCIEITKVLMAQTGDGTNEDLLAACTKRFRKLLEKGYEPSPDGGIGYFDYDFRYETQDSYPRISKMGPAVLERETIKVPVDLRFDAYGSSEGESFRKTWIFVREHGNWKADDLLTERANEPVTSLAQELSKAFSE
jgi:CHAT domain-containing protein/TPR repeat protein